MKKRERRRYLTDKYQQRQVRLANQDRAYRPYDKSRYLQRPLAIKQRFFDELKGNIVGPEWGDRERKWRTESMLNGWGDTTPFTKAELGRFRRHSYHDCGRPRCPHCGNPRRNHWWKGQRQTLQERVNLMRFNDDLQYYYEEN